MALFLAHAPQSMRSIGGQVTFECLKCRHTCTISNIPFVQSIKCLFVVRCCCRRCRCCWYSLWWHANEWIKQITKRIFKALRVNCFVFGATDVSNNLTEIMLLMIPFRRFHVFTFLPTSGLFFFSLSELIDLENVPTFFKLQYHFHFHLPPKHSLSYRSAHSLTADSPPSECLSRVLFLTFCRCVCPFICSV